jgi:hypothetical protein
MIYPIVNVNQFIDAFKNEAVNSEDFSHDGLTALYEYLDQKELDRSDVLAIRCEFAEYATATAAAIDCGWTGCTLDTTENEQEEAQALEWLEQQTVIIPFDKGLVVLTSI